MDKFSDFIAMVVIVALCILVLSLMLVVFLFLTKIILKQITGIRDLKEMERAQKQIQKLKDKYGDDWADF